MRRRAQDVGPDLACLAEARRRRASSRALFLTSCRRVHAGANAVIKTSPKAYARVKGIRDRLASITKHSAQYVDYVW